MTVLKTVSRYHDISCGHRVVGHEGKCVGLHGHNYRIHFECEAPALDEIGRVIDFGVIKSELCMWVEDNWDHNTLLWDRDSALHMIQHSLDNSPTGLQILNSLRPVPFNPTAENMATYLLAEIGPRRLAGTGVTLTKVTIEETRKCSAAARLTGDE